MSGGEQSGQGRLSSLLTRRSTDLRLNQISIKVSDLERSKAFYAIIGLRLIVDSPGNMYARFECVDGGTTFSLSEVDDVVPGETGLYFEVDNVAATVDALMARGVDFETPVTKEPWLWTEAWFRDPDGHRLCLYHAGKARRFPPWRIT
ncbi:MAG: VOC family protein [Pseudomonadota bacterium]